MAEKGYRSRILQALVADLQSGGGSSPKGYQISAVWEGGSAANGTSDPYSDIDLNILVAGPSDPVFENIERVLGSISEISHIWNEPKSLWPELTQKVYFLKDAPKHFFVDVAVFPEGAGKILAEFMQVERHGTPVVHFDSLGLIQAQPADRSAWAEKRRKRLAEILEAFPVYRTEVFKELDRGHAIDAFAFYQGGMLRPLVEVLGMLHRPFQFDFGLRYLHRKFPPELSREVERFLYVADIDALRERATELEKLFYSAVEQVRGG